MKKLSELMAMTTTISSEVIGQLKGDVDPPGGETEEKQCHRDVWKKVGWAGRLRQLVD